MAYVTNQATTQGGGRTTGRGMAGQLGALAACPGPPAGRNFGGAVDGTIPRPACRAGYSSCYGQGLVMDDFERIRPRRFRPGGAGDRRSHAGSKGRRLSGLGRRTQGRITHGRDKEQAFQQGEKPHTVSGPYSKDTMGNIPVKLGLVV